MEQGVVFHGGLNYATMVHCFLPGLGMAKFFPVGTIGKGLEDKRIFLPCESGMFVSKL